MKDSLYLIDYLVDTGPLVGFFDADDEWHRWSDSALSVLGGPLLTTEMVVTEACYLLGKHTEAVQGLLELVEDGYLRVCATLPENIVRIRALMSKYPQMDLADASLVVLSEQHPRAKLITLDRTDFTVYRRDNGTPVPCLMPLGPPQ